LKSSKCCGDLIIKLPYHLIAGAKSFDDISGDV
jgi:hypothetical protein